MIIKLVSELGHIGAGEKVIYDHVFIGETESTIREVGMLTLRLGEWQLLGAALLLGAERTNGQLKAIVVGDAEIIKDKKPAIDAIYESFAEQQRDELDKKFMGHWEEDPKYPVEDWKYEVANDDTRQSYAEWVKAKKETNP